MAERMKESEKLTRSGEVYFAAEYVDSRGNGFMLYFDDVNEALEYMQNRWGRMCDNDKNTYLRQAKPKDGLTIPSYFGVYKGVSVYNETLEEYDIDMVEGYNPVWEAF